MNLEPAVTPIRVHNTIAAVVEMYAAILRDISQQISTLLLDNEALRQADKVQRATIEVLKQKLLDKNAFESQ